MPLADDGLWAHPWLADHGDLRADLLALAPDIPAMLDRMDTFVQCVPHGDASPQNLLVPADDPETFVVIDISFRTPHALGFDLGQLLVGLTHAGVMPAARMPEVAAAIVPAYLDGVHEEGVVDQDEQARDAFATGVLLRSGFDGFLYELLEDADAAQRARVRRTGRDVPGAGGALPKPLTRHKLSNGSAGRARRSRRCRRRCRPASRRAASRG